MNYKSLCKTYVDEASVLKIHIGRIKKQHIVLEDPAEELKFKNRISILYSMYLDLLHTSEYLERKCRIMKI